MHASRLILTLLLIRRSPIATLLAGRSPLLATLACLSINPCPFGLRARALCRLTTRIRSPHPGPHRHHAFEAENAEQAASIAASRPLPVTSLPLTRLPWSPGRHSHR